MKLARGASRTGSAILRPPADLLARIDLPSARPAILLHGGLPSGPFSAAPILTERWPDATFLDGPAGMPGKQGQQGQQGGNAIDGTADLVFADLTAAAQAATWQGTQAMTRTATQALTFAAAAGLVPLLKPGAVLACHAACTAPCNARLAHVIREVRKEYEYEEDTREDAEDEGDFGPKHTPLSDILALHASLAGGHTRTEPAEPLLQDIDAWTTAYVSRHQGDAWVRPVVLAAARAELGLPEAGVEGGEDFNAFIDECCARALARGGGGGGADGGGDGGAGDVVWPVDPSDGARLSVQSRLFLVARRPTEKDAYGDYVAYQNHQLEKGWKS